VVDFVLRVEGVEDPMRCLVLVDTFQAQYDQECDVFRVRRSFMSAGAKRSHVEGRLLGAREQFGTAHVEFTVLLAPEQEEEWQIISERLADAGAAADLHLVLSACRNSDLQLGKLLARVLRNRAQHPDVRTAIIYWAHAHKVVDAVPALIETLDDEGELMSWRARTALEHILGDAPSTAWLGHHTGDTEKLKALLFAAFSREEEGLRRLLGQD
jgi:hypothetical protein